MQRVVCWIDLRHFQLLSSKYSLEYLDTTAILSDKFQYFSQSLQKSRNIASEQDTTTYCLSINSASTVAYSNFYTFSQI